jgi:hypothetical protein
MSKRLSLLTGNNNNDLSALTVIPTDDGSVLSHIRDTTRFTSASGIMERRTQAQTEPLNYIRDKKKIWNAIIEGCDGNGNDAAGANANTSKLNVALPGAANRNIPKMSSLVVEWQNTFRTLRDSGVPKDTAAFQADSHTNSLFNQRTTMFTSAFPGLIDDAYEAGLDGVNMETKLREMVSGISDIPKSYKFEKYKKRAKKYKANKRSTTTKST